MDSDTLMALNECFPCRNRQISRLCTFFREDADSKSPDYILLEGLPGSGRTKIVQRMMEIRNDFYILINCVECYTTRLLHFHLLYGLFNTLKDTFEEVDSLGTVYNYFRKSEAKEKLRCIILKNSHLLSMSVLLKLCQFQESLIRDGWNFSLVFISEDSVHVTNLPIHFVRVLFPLYNKDELTEILTKGKKEIDENGLEIFRNFLQFFLPTIVPIYGELPDVKRLVDKFFPVYRKPIDDGRLTVNQVGPLGNLLIQSLKIQKFSLMYVYSENNSNARINDIMDLPLGTKYLLVAAFLASFVPKSKDRMFTESSNKKKKRGAFSTRRKDQKEITEPKPFTFRRLMFIYEAIEGDKTKLNVNLISKVAALLDIGLLIPYEDLDRENLNEPQYKCVANPSCVHALAKNIEIDLNKYLSS